MTEETKEEVTTEATPVVAEETTDAETPATETPETPETPAAA